MNKTTIYLPDSLQIALDNLAHRTNRSKADLIREAVTTFVERQERPWPKSIGMIDYDDEVNSTNVDEWLRENWKPD
jgi:hypothetical protein